MGLLKRRIIELMEPTEYELARRWIPVDERLPEDDSECLTVDADGIRRVARFDAIGDGERPSWYTQADFRTIYPVAWMPLPEPPEVKP